MNNKPTWIIGLAQNGMGKGWTYWLSQCKREILYGGITPVLAMSRARSSTSASNGLMRRCLVRRQDERVSPTFCVFEPLYHRFSLNERILLANSKVPKFVRSTCFL